MLHYVLQLFYSLREKLSTSFQVHLFAFCELNLNCASPLIYISFIDIFIDKSRRMFLTRVDCDFYLKQLISFFCSCLLVENRRIAETMCYIARREKRKVLSLRSLYVFFNFPERHETIYT